MLFREISEIWTVLPCQLNVEDFFSLAGNRPFAFLYGNGPGTRWLIFGEVPLLVLTELNQCMPRFHRSGSLPPVFPDFIGHVSYEYNPWHASFLSSPIDKPFAFPNCYLVAYQNIHLYDMEMGLLYKAIRSGVDAICTVTSSTQRGLFTTHKIWESDTSGSYQNKVKDIRQEIAIGNVYQVNLTRQERWHFSGDLKQFARHLFEVNPAPFSALVVGLDFSIVSSSPERFFKISCGKITTSPIKGTAARSDNYNMDVLLKSNLLASDKDRSELAMIADLMRNDLTRICRIPSVCVDAFPRLESYTNVHHLVADVSGDLLPDTTLESLFIALFPGGSITGCPKIAAMNLIRELEVSPRMVYTGALGWLTYDLSQADFNIAIRTTWASHNELMFGVGGGVVWDSDPYSEYQETIHKASSIIKCLIY
jgi:para-aminobenzoate synthetase component 1